MVRDHQGERRPDDICGVCGFKREEHGDAHHRFTLDDDLQPLLVERPKPRQEAPRERSDRPATLRAGDATQQGVDLGDSLTMNAMARLVERLIEKGILNALDVLYVFGAHAGPPHNDGRASEEARGSGPVNT